MAERGAHYKAAIWNSDLQFRDPKGKSRYNDAERKQARAITRREGLKSYGVGLGGGAAVGAGTAMALKKNPIRGALYGGAPGSIAGGHVGRVRGQRKYEKELGPGKVKKNMSTSAFGVDHGDEVSKAFGPATNAKKLGNSFLRRVHTQKGGQQANMVRANRAMKVEDKARARSAGKRKVLP